MTIDQAREKLFILNAELELLENELDVLRYDSPARARYLKAMREVAQKIAKTSELIKELKNEK